MSYGLVTLGTTTENDNLELYKNIKPDKIVLEWIRVLVSNRLSKNGLQWAKMFAEFNSGTYNNQWMIVDYSKFIPQKTPEEGLFYALEQMPGYIEYDNLMKSS